MVNGLSYELAMVKLKHITCSLSQMNASGREVVTIVYPVGNFSKFIRRLSSSEFFSTWTLTKMRRKRKRLWVWELQRWRSSPGLIWSQNSTFLLKWLIQATSPRTFPMEFVASCGLNWNNTSVMFVIAWMDASDCTVPVWKDVLPTRQWIRITVLGWTCSVLLLPDRAWSLPGPPVDQVLLETQHVYRATINNRLSIVRWSSWDVASCHGKSDGWTSQNGKSECLLPCRGQTRWFSTHAHGHRVL